MESLKVQAPVSVNQDLTPDLTAVSAPPRPHNPPYVTLTSQTGISWR